jgi:hypothetical protein
MGRKLVALVTLILFTLFSCQSISINRIDRKAYITELVKTREIPSENRKYIIVLGVVTTTNKWIEFENESGRILIHIIEGDVADESRRGLKRIYIPLSKVQWVWLKRFSMGKTLWKYLVVPAGVILTSGILILFIAFALSDPFCPFIYSFDGNTYTMEAEPFAGSIAPGFKKTEWTVLRSLSEVNRQYRLLVVNEVDKADYLDHLQLLAVDHPSQLRVIPGLSGTLHTITHPVAPLRAYDREGRDLLPYVSKDDGLSWQLAQEGNNPVKIAEPKMELVFTFPKPPHAIGAKVIFKGGNTFWGAGIIKRHLDLYGKQGPAVLEEIKNQGPAFTKIKNMFSHEEFLSLQLRVNTTSGWETRGIIPGGSPLVPGPRVYPVDLEGVPGDTLEIKLTPPAASWMIDYIAVDYSPDLPVKVTGLPVLKTTGYEGNSKKAKKLLAEEDNHYLKLSPTGTSIHLIFNSPPLYDGMERTIILETSGYYDIQLEPGGEPQHEILKRIYSEPCFLLQFELNEYKKLKNGLKDIKVISGEIGNNR